jgi:CRP-like cAMP-binding protein
VSKTWDYVAFATDISANLCQSGGAAYETTDSGDRMVDTNVGHHWSENGLLAAMPAIDRAMLEPHAKFVELARGQVLFEPEDDVVITHFPLTGTMAALVVVLEDGGTAEGASIGREGAIGGIVSAGHKPAFARAVTQIAGSAFRIETARIEIAKQRSSAVRDLFSRYADALLAQVLQSVVCNAFHPMRQRLARWLLTTQDRIASTELPLTQEYLAQMLGVHRSTVIRVARSLHDDGVIRNARGRLTVVNRAKLEKASCECYGAVARHYARILRLTEEQRVKNAKAAAKHKPRPET